MKSLFKKEYVVTVFDKKGHYINSLSSTKNSNGMKDYSIVKRSRKSNIDKSYIITERYINNVMVGKDITILNWVDGCKAKSIGLYISKYTGKVDYEIVKEY